MKLITIYNMEKTRIGRWFMEGYPAKYHALPFVGVMTFTGPRGRASESLVKHELIHHYQAEREGWFGMKWMINYYRELHAVGYMLNKYEKEAYAGAHDPLTLKERKLTGYTRRLTWLPEQS